MRWTLYPSQNIGNSDLQYMHIDILNLQGHDVDFQQTVVRKIKCFISRLAHKILVDMIKHRKYENLADVWCTSSVNSTKIAQLDEVNMIFFC